MPKRVEIVGTGEIAAEFGVKTQTVRDLWAKHPRWPAPYAIVAGRPLWDAIDVRIWAVTWRRRPGRPRKLT